MKNKSTIRQSSEIRADLAVIRPEVKLTLAKHTALQKRKAFLSEVIESELCYPKGGGGDIENQASLGGGAVAFCKSEMAQELATVCAIREVLEQSEFYAAAIADLQPLLTELSLAESAEAEKLHNLRLAEQAVKEAEQAALAAFDPTANPAVVQARERLAAVSI